MEDNKEKMIELLKQGILDTSLGLDVYEQNKELLPEGLLESLRLHHKLESREKLGGTENIHQHEKK